MFGSGTHPLLAIATSTASSLSGAVDAVWDAGVLGGYVGVLCCCDVRVQGGEDEGDGELHCCEEVVGVGLEDGSFARDREGEVLGQVFVVPLYLFQTLNFTRTELLHWTTPLLAPSIIRYSRSSTPNGPKHGRKL